MSLGTKNRQMQTARNCKQHLRQLHMDKLVIVEEFIHEIERSSTDRDMTKWGKFTDLSHNQVEMPKRLDVHTEKWFNRA